MQLRKWDIRSVRMSPVHFCKLINVAPVIQLKAVLVIFLALFSAVATRSQSAVILSESAFLRGEPSDTGEVVDTLVRDTKVRIITKKGIWYLVQASPFVGWVHRNSLRLRRSSKSAQVAQQKTKSTPDAQPSTAAAKSSPQPIVEPTQPAGTTDTSAATKTAPVSGPSKDGRVYIRGQLGGCYFMGSGGKRVYVDRGFCN